MLEAKGEGLHHVDGICHMDKYTNCKARILESDKMGFTGRVRIARGLQSVPGGSKVVRSDEVVNDADEEW